MNDSPVISPSHDRQVTIKESYLRICGDDRSCAVLLSILENWTVHEERENRIRKRENQDDAKQGSDDLQNINEALWVRRTRDEIVADSLGLLNKKNVTEAANKLEEWGLIESGHPRRSEGDNSKQYRLRLDRINAMMRREVLEDQENHEQREEMIQEKEEKRRKKEDPDDDTYWDENDWQYKYARRWWERQDELGDGRIPYTWRQKKEKLLQNWADAFDWVTRVREVPREKLDNLIIYMYEEEGWWIQTGNLVAPTKFRDKNGQGQWRLEEWLMKMNIEQSGKGPGESYNIPDKGEEVPEWKKRKIIEDNDEVDEDDFLSCGWTEDGMDKLYAYQT